MDQTIQVDQTTTNSTTYQALKQIGSMAAAAESRNIAVEQPHNTLEADVRENASTTTMPEGFSPAGPSQIGGSAKGSTVLLEELRSGGFATIDYRGLKLADINIMTTRQFLKHLDISTAFLENHPLFELDISHAENCARLVTWVEDNKPENGDMTEHVGHARANPTGSGMFYPFSLPAAIRPTSASLCMNGQRPPWYSDERCLTCKSKKMSTRTIGGWKVRDLQIVWQVRSEDI